MKHELETTIKPGAFWQKNALKILFSKLDKTELIENTALLLLCRISFLGYLISPLGIAYFAVLFFSRRRLSYVLCAAIGIFSVGYPTFSLKYGGIILILSALGIIFQKELKNKIRLQAVLATAALLLNGAIYVMYEGMFAYDMLMLTAECGIAFLAFFAFSKATGAISTFSVRTVFEQSEIVSLVFLCGAVVFSISMINTLLPFAHVLAVASILILSSTLGFSVSCPAGIVFGLSLGLADAYSAQTVCVYCLASFASGFVRQHGKAMVCFAFYLTGTCASLLLCPEADGIVTVAYVALAAVVLFLLPDSILVKFGSLTAKAALDEPLGARICRTVEDQFNEAVSSMDSVSLVFKNVMDELFEPMSEPHGVVFDKTAEAVCKNCSLCKFCWNKSREETLACMEDMYKIMERKNAIAKTDVPQTFTDMCIRRDVFLAELNKNYESYKVTRMWAGRVAESKRLVAEQFSNISMILSNMKDRLKARMQYEPELERKILGALDRRGIFCDKVSVCSGDGFSVTMDKVSCGEKLVCSTTVAAAISEVLEVPMLRENRVCSDDVCHLTFSQQTRFEADIAFASATRKHSTSSGDSAIFFPCGNGKIAVILSDGMGSGEKAHFLSSVTTRLAKNLLTAGFDKENCVRLINNILMTNADKDTFATIDLCILNLYTGTMEFVKTGSSNSYLKSKDGNETIYASSLPAGLVQSLDPDYDMRYMKAGEYLIMVTDGVSDALDTPDHNKIFDIAEGFSGSPQELANNVLNAALFCSDGIAYDDMTVAVCAIGEK